MQFLQFQLSELKFDAEPEARSKSMHSMRKRPMPGSLLLLPNSTSSLNESLEMNHAQSMTSGQNLVVPQTRMTSSHSVVTASILKSDIAMRRKFAKYLSSIKNTPGQHSMHRSSTEKEKDEENNSEIKVAKTTQIKRVDPLMVYLKKKKETKKRSTSDTKNEPNRTSTDSNQRQVDGLLLVQKIN